MNSSILWNVKSTVSLSTDVWIDNDLNLRIHMSTTLFRRFDWLFLSGYSVLFETVVCLNFILLSTRTTCGPPPVQQANFLTTTLPLWNLFDFKFYVKDKRQKLSTKVRLVNVFSLSCRFIILMKLVNTVFFINEEKLLYKYYLTIEAYEEISKNYWKRIRGVFRSWVMGFVPQRKRKSEQIRMVVDVRRRWVVIFDF